MRAVTFQREVGDSAVLLEDHLGKMGFVFISDLESTDSGVYTCTAKSESGETYSSGWLKVGGEPERGPEPGALPRAPSNLRLVNSSLHAITLAWDPPQGASTLSGYTVEYYSPDLQTGWVIAARSVINHAVTVSLLPILRPILKLEDRLSTQWKDLHYICVVNTSNKSPNICVSLIKCY